MREDGGKKVVHVDGFDVLAGLRAGARAHALLTLAMLAWQRGNQNGIWILLEWLESLTGGRCEAVHLLDPH